MSDGINARIVLERAPFRLAVDLHLPGRGVTAVYGPSGAGKTLLLRAIAGLEHARGGHVEINGAVWQDDAHGIFVPTHRRALGFVFQEASLFPHLSVRGNLQFAQRRARGAAMLDACASLLGIDALLERSPHNLSGGERQRVAIARALLSNPALLLFDEPLASVDLNRRAEILPYLERLHHELQVPSLYVTHMPDEAARLADHLVLLEDGRVRASGPLQQTLTRLDLPPAFADAACAVIDAQLATYDGSDRIAQLNFAGGTLYVPHASVPVGPRLRCRIEARDVSIALTRTQDSSILNIIAANIVEMTEQAGAAQVLVRLDAGGVALLARITRRSCNALQLAPGKAVWAQIKAVALVGLG